VGVNADDERRYVEFVAGRLAWLRKVAFLLCQDWHRADDLAQAAITRLYVHWSAASRADNLDAYARRVLVREFLSARRTVWGSRVDLQPDPVREASAPDADPVTRVMVRVALAQVPPRQRAALVLRYYCDLSVEETADVLRCSPGTVKSQTSRGLAALRRALDGEPIGAHDTRR
jgi:RNA polymerase sigma-70 factor (sigma-E family)